MFSSTEAYVLPDVQTEGPAHDMQDDNQQGFYSSITGSTVEASAHIYDHQTQGRPNVLFSLTHNRRVSNVQCTGHDSAKVFVIFDDNIGSPEFIAVSGSSALLLVQLARVLHRIDSN